MNKDAIKNIILGMSDMIDKKQIELYTKLIDENGFDHLHLDDLDEFYFGLISPHEEFINGLLKTKISKNKDVIFIYMNSLFIERSFTYWFERVEGAFACADKGRTVVKHLIRWFLNEERIEFNYNGEYTYHLPKTIFKTHESIIEFYEGIKSLRYGNPTKYLAALKNITDEISENKIDK